MRDGWVELKFNDVAKAFKGKLPKGKNELGIGLPYLTANYLRSNSPDFWIENIEGAVVAEEGECLILWDGAGAGDLFKARNGVVSSTMAIVKSVNPSILREFLTLFIASKSNYIKETCRGTTVPHVSPDAIDNMNLMIPPLAEQKRIVDLISSVDSYIEALQQQLDKARKSRNAVLHELLTKSGDGWIETTLGDLANLQMGRTPSRRNSDYWTEDTKFPFCTIADMSTKRINPKREGVTKKAILDGKAKCAKAGTLLMSFKLTIGRMGFAGVDLYPNEAIVMIENNPLIVSKEFLYYKLESMDLTENAGRAVKGSTLNSASIAAIKLGLPPLVEQKRIVEIISVFDNQIEALDSTITKTQNLRSGLLSDLLSGNHEIPNTYDKLIGAA